jgi:hypothetical protein
MYLMCLEVRPHFDKGEEPVLLCKQLANWLTAKLLLALARTVILGSESHGTHDHILLTDGSRILEVVISPPNMGGPRFESEPGTPATWRFLAIFFRYCKRILACLLQQAITCSFNVVFIPR